MLASIARQNMSANNIFNFSPEDGADPERFKSMSISRNPTGCTIAPRSKSVDPLIVTQRHTNMVNDIRGAVPKLSTGKPRDTFFATQDIPGAQPRALIVEHSGHFGLTSMEGIHGARARTTELRTKRVVNPLDPHYSLPSAPEVVFPVPAFKRDLFKVDDIEGTKPILASDKPLRAGVGIDDIDGARPRKVKELQGYQDTLDVQDINVAGVFKTQRKVDPLQPTYAINGMVVVDEPARIVPVSRRARDDPLRSLITADIEGATPMTLSTTMIGSSAIGSRKDFNITNRLDDIDGAHTGTRRMGLKSMRVTDPNEREYPLLDGRALESDELAVGHGWYVASAKIAEHKARLDETRKLALTATVVPEAAPLSPAAAFARKFIDPRDLELAKLRGELNALRQRPGGVPVNEVASTRNSVVGSNRNSNGGSVRSSLAPTALNQETMDAAVNAFGSKRPSLSLDTAAALETSTPTAARTPMQSAGAKVVTVNSKQAPIPGDASDMKFSSGVFNDVFKKKVDHQFTMRSTLGKADLFRTRQAARAAHEDVYAVRSLP